MESEINIDKILEILQATGFTREESLIYYTLIKYGQIGTTVRNLSKEIPLIRTTIYSILRRLVGKRQVFEKETSNIPNKAKLFTCLEPSKFFNQLLSNKMEELKKFEEQRLIFMKTMQELYLKKREISFENLDKFIRPYFKPLLRKKWEISSQVVEKTFGVNIYEYHINSPKATKRIPYCIFNVYDFNDSFMKNVSLSENFKLDLSYFSDKLFLQDLLKDAETNFVLYFYIKRLEERIKSDDLLIKYKMFKNYRIREVKERFLGKPYPFLTFEAISKKGTEYHEFMKVVLLPIKNKLFCLWAESLELLKEMYECISMVEKST